MSEALASGSRKSRATLWLLIALCAAPVVASYVAYYWWQPSGHVNYGELLQPRTVPDVPLPLADGTTFRMSQLRGKWTLLMADGAECDTHCLEKLTYLRQLRLAQGKDSDRVERVWLLTDDRFPSSAVLAQYTGTYAVRAKDTAVLAMLQATGVPSEHIYVIDPLGNLMMRYPPNPEPRRMLKDLARLLRHSQWADSLGKG